MAVEDPRLDSETVRVLPAAGDRGRTVLVGVVHDHPASVFRVQTVIDEFDPTVVALELPPLAVPLFRQYASDETIPPRRGGEMSAALQAAGGSAVVGIDLPRIHSTRTLLKMLSSGSVSLRTAWRVLTAVGSLSAHAIQCRLAAVWGRVRGTPTAVDESLDHTCSVADSPTDQAADEARIRSVNTSLLRAFDRPHALSIFDQTRETEMATALASLRTTGDVVAVVGFAHLDAIESQLCD